MYGAFLLLYTYFSQATRPRVSVEVMDVGSFVTTYSNTSINGTNITKNVTSKHNELEVKVDVDADTDHDGEADDFTDIDVKEEADDSVAHILMETPGNSSQAEAANLANLKTELALPMPAPLASSETINVSPTMDLPSKVRIDLPSKAQEDSLTAEGDASDDSIKQAQQSADAATLGDLAKQAMTDVMSAVSTGPLGKLTADMVDSENGKGSMGDMIQEALQSGLEKIAGSSDGTLLDGLDLDGSHGETHLPAAYKRSAVKAAPSAEADGANIDEGDDSDDESSDDKDIGAADYFYKEVEKTTIDFNVTVTVNDTTPAKAEAIKQLVTLPIGAMVMDTRNSASDKMLPLEMSSEPESTPEPESTTAPIDASTTMPEPHASSSDSDVTVAAEKATRLGTEDGSGVEPIAESVWPAIQAVYSGAV
mmetsp:Transcript_27845/g.51072  ORF Transcript_27845/g.51072 Transcript_27845/m.51072 type:complete len:423 (-) Transcript_27845:166-1434(-)